MHPKIMHNARNPSSLARTRDLISMIAQCLRGHSADPQTRFLVPARNDAVVAYVITIIYRKARLTNEAVLHVYLATQLRLPSASRVLPNKALLCVLPSELSSHFT